MYNEEESLSELCRRLGGALATLGGETEVILVDDGSTDGSFRLAQEIHVADRRFKVARLSRNFGHQMAITAGLDLAAGDAVIVMDADLQHPPELIPDFVARWRAGFDVVYGVMDRRPGETWFKRKSAAFFYTLLRRLAGVNIPAAASDFRLIDAKALDAFRSMRETNRFVRGMFAWIGFRQCPIHYAVAPRYAGSTKYTVTGMLTLALDGLVSFSEVPLLRVIKLGFAISLAGFLFGLSALISKIAGGFTVPGWASIMLVASVLGGAQLIVLGVVGEYIARIFQEVKQRPLYVLDELCGIDTRRPLSEGSRALASTEDVNGV